MCVVLESRFKTLASELLLRRGLLLSRLTQVFSFRLRLQKAKSAPEDTPRDIVERLQAKNQTKPNNQL